MESKKNLKSQTSRSVSFVQRWKWKWSGNITNESLKIGDLDNDGNNEFVIGSITGTVGIFKGQMLWKSFENLGTITAVAIGDVWNNGNNSLIVGTGEGQCHIIEISKVKSDNEDSMENVITKTVTIPVPVNVSRILIADIDGDGYNELVLGRTDRFLHSFQLMKTDTSSTVALDNNNTTGLAVIIIHNDNNTEKVLLREKKNWSFDGQLGSVAITYDQKKNPILMVAQPGGVVVLINKNGEIMKEKENTSNGSIEVSTELITDIKGVKGTNYSAMITMDGNINFYYKLKKEWTLQVNSQLFAISKIDCTNDGNEELVISSWNGLTYIVDHYMNVVEFDFEERVCAFIAGNYAIAPDKNVPCMFFVTFDDVIYVYYDICLSSIYLKTLSDVLDKDIEMHSDIIEELGFEPPANGKKRSRAQYAEIFQKLFYNTDLELLSEVHEELQERIHKLQISGVSNIRLNV